MNKPCYSGPGRTGICICGHSWEGHHLGIVMNQEYFDNTDEAYVPEECEVCGLDSDGRLHCFVYKDSGMNEIETT